MSFSLIMLQPNQYLYSYVLPVFQVEPCAPCTRFCKIVYKLCVDI